MISSYYTYDTFGLPLLCCVFLVMMMHDASSILISRDTDAARAAQTHDAAFDER